MVEFEVVSLLGPLDAQRITAGNTQRYRARFDVLLDRGVTVTGATAAVTSLESTLVSTTSAPTLSDDRLSVFWLVTAASLVESFTLTLTVTTLDGQTLAFEVLYNVVALG